MQILSVFSAFGALGPSLVVVDVPLGFVGIQFLRGLQEVVNAFTGRDRAEKHVPAQVLVDGPCTVARPGTPLLDISPQPFDSFSCYFTVNWTHKVLLVADGKVVEPVVIQASVGSPAVSMDRFA